MIERFLMAVLDLRRGYGWHAAHRLRLSDPGLPVRQQRHQPGGDCGPLDGERRVWHNLVCRQGYTWDLPNIMRGDADTGERTFGNDYSQDLMLWSLPAALAGQTVDAPAKPGGLVDRILRAAQGE